MKATLQVPLFEGTFHLLPTSCHINCDTRPYILRPDATMFALAFLIYFTLVAFFTYSLTPLWNFYKDSPDVADQCNSIITANSDVSGIGVSHFPKPPAATLGRSILYNYNRTRTLYSYGKFATDSR